MFRVKLSSKLVNVGILLAIKDVSPDVVDTAQLLRWPLPRHTLLQLHKVLLELDRPEHTEEVKEAREDLCVKIEPRSSVDMTLRPEKNTLLGPCPRLDSRKLHVEHTRQLSSDRRVEKKLLECFLLFFRQNVRSEDRVDSLFQLLYRYLALLQA